MSSMRLHRVLADAGLGSRRLIEEWIRAGRVTINDKKAVVGQPWQEGDSVVVDGKPVKLNPVRSQRPRVIAYNKPEGEICSRRDPEGRPSVFDVLPRLRQGRWVLVGRLDINTSGLLLATDSGELANRLMHPSAGLEREYRVRVLGAVDSTVLARLRAGVELEDGAAAFEKVREVGGEGANRWFAVILHEGRNREVRRLWESQGLTVSRLKRVRFGPVSLGVREHRGQWRELTEAEVDSLCERVGLKPSSSPVPADTPAKPKAGLRRRK
jgi:23S rRNA pseudouridine2605 synthase